MSEQQTPQHDLVPEWDQADRMRKALRTADVGVAELADYLDVSRNTVSTWINGRIQPSTQTLRLVAIRCGVPFDWLRDGTEPRRGPGNRPLGGVAGGPDGVAEQDKPPTIWYVGDRTQAPLVAVPDVAAAA